eukprot:8786774-Pyramimonas_sp.AAC.1
MFALEGAGHGAGGRPFGEAGPDGEAGAGAAREAAPRRPAPVGAQPPAREPEPRGDALLGPLCLPLKGVCICALLRLVHPLFVSKCRF